MKSELVMRARHLVFHVNCFSCDVCNTPLTRGDYYSIKDSSVYCRIHFDTQVDQSGASYIYMPSLHDKDEQITANSNNKILQDEDRKIFNKFYSHPNESPQKGRQKGRPRKRKQKGYEGIGSTLGKHC